MSDPHGRLLCANPLLAVYDGIFGAEIAGHVKATYGPKLGPAAVGTLAGRDTGNPHRTHSEVAFDLWSDPVLVPLGLAVSAILRLPPENAEPSKLLHYTGDEVFDLHLDAFNDFAPGHVLRRRNGGQRLFTTLLYLNDVAEGGVTEYPHLKIAVRPRLGRIFVGGHTIPGTDAPHPHAAHAARPVGPGQEKWVLSMRWRERPHVEVRDYPPAEGEISVI